MRILKCSLAAAYFVANFPPPRAFVLERESNRTLKISIHYSHPLIQRPLFPLKGPQIQLQRLKHWSQCHKKVVRTMSFDSEQYQTKALHLYSPLTDQVLFKPDSSNSTSPIYGKNYICNYSDQALDQKP